MLTSFRRSTRSSDSRRLPLNRGFTLVELLVVMAIMVIITSLVLVQQSKFDSSTLLRSLGYSIALSVRQAQVYGTSVLGTTTGSGGETFVQSYGVFFSSGSPSSYILFADLNNDGKYEPGEEVKVFTLGAGYTISNFCATTTGGSPIQRCEGTISYLNVIFKRPNPDAQFSTSILGESYGSVYIQIANAGSTRSITVTSTGQISVGGSGT